MALSPPELQDEEWCAIVMATENGPTLILPPEFIGLTFSIPCLPAQSQISALPVTCAPVFFAIATVSPM